MAAMSMPITFVALLLFTRYLLPYIERCYRLAHFYLSRFSQPPDYASVTDRPASAPGSSVGGVGVSRASSAILCWWLCRWYTMESAVKLSFGYAAWGLHTALVTVVVVVAWAIVRIYLSGFAVMLEPGQEMLCILAIILVHALLRILQAALACHAEVKAQQAMLRNEEQLMRAAAHLPLQLDFTGGALRTAPDAAARGSGAANSSVPDIERGLRSPLVPAPQYLQFDNSLGALLHEIHALCRCNDVVPTVFGIPLNDATVTVVQGYLVSAALALIGKILATGGVK
jgi:hypothetical protein